MRYKLTDNARKQTIDGPDGWNLRQTVFAVCTSRGRHAEVSDVTIGKVDADRKRRLYHADGCVRVGRVLADGYFDSI